MAGTLHLGRVRSGVVVEKHFKIRNLVDKEIEPWSIRPSCSCTTARLPRGTIESEQLSDVGVVSISIPRTSGDGRVLARIEIINEQGRNEGRITVVGDVERPFDAGALRFSRRVLRSTAFHARIPLSIADFADRERFTVSSKTKAISASIRGDDLRLRGDSNIAIANSPLVFEIGYEDENWQVKDQLVIDVFEDGILRVIPASMTRSSPILRCVVVTPPDSEREALIVKTENGEAVPFKSSRVGKLRRLSIDSSDLPFETSNLTFVVGDAMVSVPLISEVSRD